MNSALPLAGQKLALPSETRGALGLVWATDWRLILHWVPYVNTKFKRGD